MQRDRHEKDARGGVQKIGRALPCKFWCTAVQIYLVVGQVRKKVERAQAGGTAVGVFRRPLATEAGPGTTFSSQIS